MDYEKKYKNALEWARQVMTGETGFIRKEVEEIFPELAESEGERIRKALISVFSNREKYLIDQSFGDITVSEALAWLEKQGDKCLVNFDEAEQEKYDFVSGQFIECRKSFNEFKEDNSYWFEYVGDDNYIGRSDNILNQKFHITPRQLFTLFTWQHRPKEDSNVNDEANAPTGYGKYVDECLNEASKHFFSEGEDKYSVADLFYAGVRCGKSWFEKQIEQKSFDYENANIQQKDFAPKDEPKFHEGEWITNGDYTWIIVGVKPLDYVLQSQDGNIVVDTISHVDEQFHSFTIADARDGDVLADNDGVILFRKIGNERYADVVDYYCVVNTNGRFEIQEKFDYWGEANDAQLHPTTKEQCDTLLKAMADAGYTFDFEKKELKKIEQKPTTIDIDKMVDDYANNKEPGNEIFGRPVPCMVRAYRQGLNDAIRKVVLKPVWSENEMKMLDNLITYLNGSKGLLKETKSIYTDLLKSLKERIKNA